MTDPASTRVLLLRHAETAAPDLFHGAESDVGLGPAGIAQAEVAAQAIAPSRPVAVYSSAMRRARLTAEPIAQACGCPTTAVAALHERRMGALSGRPMAEGWSAYQSAMQAWQRGDLDATHVGGESFRALRDRVVPALQAIAERHRGETVVVVAHGIVIRVVLATLLDGEPTHFDRYGIGFVAVNDLRTDGQTWHAVALNGLPV